MSRFAYRNFGTYQSWLVSQTVQVGTGTNQQTGVRWYELRGSTGNPTLYQSGTVTNGNSLYRFTPSIAQDQSANAVVGYSVSSSSVHPAIRAAYWNLGTTGATPTEITLENGSGDEENSNHWGNLTSMTVDPTDDCTFWYVNQYYQQDETGTEINWNTRIRISRFPPARDEKLKGSVAWKNSRPAETGGPFLWARAVPTSVASGHNVVGDLRGAAGKAGDVVLHVGQALIGRIGRLRRRRDGLLPGESLGNRVAGIKVPE